MTIGLRYVTFRSLCYRKTQIRLSTGTKSRDDSRRQSAKFGFFLWVYRRRRM